MLSCGTTTLLVVLGCTASPPASKGNSQAAVTPTQPALVRVVARDFAFDSAHTAPAGLVAIRLVNTGGAIHMLGVGRLDSGKTVADLYRAMSGTQPIHWFSELGGPGAVSPGDSVTQYVVLQPGTYSMICFWPDSTGKAHDLSGMFTTLTVTGQTAGAPVEPTPDIYLRERDYNITATGAFTRGRHVFRVDNDGPQGHDVMLLRVLPGRSDAEVERWLEKPTMRDAPVEALGGTVGLERWAHATFAADLKPGQYLILCMIPDATDHRPHFMHGMVTRVSVT